MPPEPETAAVVAVAIGDTRLVAPKRRPPMPRVDPTTREALETFIHAHERWEAELIASDAAWAGKDAQPFSTAELYEGFIEVQALRNRAAAALASAPSAPAGEWRPIESAPKDGTRVLLWRVFDGTAIGRWGNLVPDDPQEWFDDGWIDNGQPICGEDDPATHWMPLPAPPSPDSGEGER